jgi:hypothetical protein
VDRLPGRVVGVNYYTSFYECLKKDTLLFYQAGILKNPVWGHERYGFIQGGVFSCFFVIL